LTVALKSQKNGSLILPTKEPRTLIAAIFPPGSPGGDWVIVHHLLRGVDWTKLSWWSFFPGETHLTKTLGERLCVFRGPQRLAPARRWKWIRGLLFETFIVPLACRQLRDFIAQQNPDQLWILSYGWAIPVFHKVVPSLGLPYHFSMHDMPETTSMVKPLGPKRAHRFLKMQDDLYRGAVSRNVVWHSMGEVMESRTGVKAECEFRCSIEPEDLEKLRLPRPEKDDSEIRIGYAGTIIAEDAFEFLVRALQKIRRELPVPIKIRLFSSHPYRDRKWFDPELITEYGHLSYKELQKPYSECHWGLSLMPLHDRDPQYSRYSFPCKFTQSLSAGLPIISIGHPKSTLMELAQRYDLGIALTTADPAEAAKTLMALLFDGTKEQTYRREAIRCAEDFFNAEDMRSSFRLFHESE